MPSRLPLGLLVLAGTVAAACGEIPEPESFAIASSTTIADAAAETDNDAPLSLTPSGSPSTTEFVPTRSDDYVPEVLISSDIEVLAADAEGVSSLAAAFGSLPAAAAVDDFLGGLVVQQSPSGATSGPGPVLWLRAEGGDPVVVDESGATLLDVGYVDGSPSAVVLVGDSQVEQIRLVDDERTSIVSLEEEEEVLDLSASGSLHAIVVSNDRCGDLRFYAADGTERDLNGPGEPDCIVPRRPAYGAVALSPDAGAVAYTQISYRDDGIEVATDLVARELSTGVEYFRIAIGADGERITALSFDGERVAYLRESDDASSAAVLNLTDQQEVAIDLTGLTGVGSVAFARLPLAGS